MQRLTPPAGPHERVTYTLEDVTFTLVYDYRPRDESWRVDVLDEEDNVIRRGLRLSPGWNPFRRFKSDLLPPGVFWFTSTTDPVGRSGFDNGLASLGYLTEAEALEILLEARAAQPAATLEGA